MDQERADAEGLRLEPQTAAHAEALFEVLCDPALYEFEGQPPAGLEAFRDRLRRLETRRSADGREQWLNWIVRLPDGSLAGYVQATVGEGGGADVAYVLGSRCWNRGIASAAVRAMVRELVAGHGVRRLRAVLKAANARSLRLLQRLGFQAAAPDVPDGGGIEADEIALHREAAPDAGPALQRRGGVALVDLAGTTSAFHAQAATLLVQDFDGPGGWAGRTDARESVDQVLREGFARALVSGERLLGWVGAMPDYRGRVCELHPLVVRRGYRRRGAGRWLVQAFEDEAARRGAVTLTLGIDDDTGMTSLAGVDLYDDLPGHLAGLRDLGRGHPFGFYRRLGWTVTGVLPDAGGPGRPGILMSKRVDRGAGA